MKEGFLLKEREEGFFNRNKPVSFAIIIACMLFIGIFFMEKSKSVINLIPKLRGEVCVENGFIITTIKNKYPILIKEDDPYIGSQLRFSGDIKSIFSETADVLCKKGDVIVEIGAHFGYNAIKIGNRLRGSIKYYAFEANPSIYSYLQKSIMLNSLEHIVTLKNLAIGDHSGYCHINDCLSLSKKQNGELATPHSIMCACNTLDKEFVGETKDITKLLIDIPGQEFAILNGAKNIINNSYGIKIIVSFDYELSSKYFNVEKELKFLEKQGFRFYIKTNSDEYEVSDISEIISEKKAVLIITREQL